MEHKTIFPFKTNIIEGKNRLELTDDDFRRNDTSVRIFNDKDALRDQMESQLKVMQEDGREVVSFSIPSDTKPFFIGGKSYDVYGVEFSKKEGENEWKMSEEGFCCKLSPVLRRFFLYETEN